MGVTEAHGFVQPREEEAVGIVIVAFSSLEEQGQAEICFLISVPKRNMLGTAEHKNKNSTFYG